jgi:hypothetical protein
MTDHVIRYVVTHINEDGMRTICGPAQGRCTKATPEEAQSWLDDVVKANQIDVNGRIGGVFGPPLKVRPVKCYPGHFDPMECIWIDDEDPHEFMNLEITMRSKTTFKTDKEIIRVWPGQSAQEVAERIASGYGATVEEIRNPDGSPYVVSGDKTAEPEIARPRNG